MSSGRVIYCSVQVMRPLLESEQVLKCGIGVAGDLTLIHQFAPDITCRSVSKLPFILLVYTPISEHPHSALVETLAFCLSFVYTWVQWNMCVVRVPKGVATCSVCLSDC